jgi:regulator of sigma E protease
MDFVVMAAAVVFVFFVLVMVHELGHFLFAKWMGVRVEKFSIGFAPTIISRKWGDTEYAIGLVPLGGYVKMAGMLDESMDAKLEGKPWEFASKKAWQKILILSGGVIFNVILAIGIFTSLYMVNGKTQNEAVVGLVRENSLAATIGLQANDTIVALNGEPIASYEELMQRYMSAFSDDGTLTVRRSGNIVDLAYRSAALGQMSFSDPNQRILRRATTVIAVVDTTAPLKPAARLGLQPGDRIVAIDGKNVQYWHEVDPLIRPFPGKRIELLWEREQQLQRDSIDIAEVYYTDANEFRHKKGMLGVSFRFEAGNKVKLPFFTAIEAGFIDSFDFLWQNAIGLRLLFTGRTKAEDSVGGIITIAAVTGSVAMAGFAALLLLLANLSLILAFFNILPLPVLDGGHITIILLELIRGKPFAVETKMRIQQIGLVLIVTLVLFVFYIDINRFL